MRFSLSQRVARMGSAIFAEVAGWKAEAQALGRDLIDLGIGSPDLPPSPRVRDVLTSSISADDSYGYPLSKGNEQFRQTVCRWYAHRFGVQLDAEREALALMGSQDGLAHLPSAIADPGDIALLPDPGYPVYLAGVEMAGLHPYFMPLTESGDYLPNFESIPEDVAQKAKLMILNYPSNPLSAVAERAFFEEAVRYAERSGILIVHDAAYSEMAFDGFRPMSILEIPGAKEVAIEFHSLSKSFHMAGCRIGFAVGNAEAVHALQVLKANIDYGVFQPVQEAGIAALEEDMEGKPSVAAHYQHRRDLFIDALAKEGWQLPKPKATMFVWARIPQGWTSRQISREMLLRTGVSVIPGDAFGKEGEGYVRMALVQSDDRLLEAAARIGKFMSENWKR
ncbi:aminotransferase class I/II-fold pyridoxal phosphate-dependent enzyme [Xylanibacillus composti]|uniref:Aminotransferase n=1 Tax=Xylanibacillus composti TaxID=1572762 RepID=A0A8J4H8F4_9BACL|nr:aminotransferase class I/II-fold pyridoxal phosphate-dependent enzyme [Xylanibacillus composti]MDT9724688.1 aminotransferase class I/II-fold pyridoxal phosphate-dependent enzyme [Xylanibacillus composti]GIQ70974.1 aminotransferase [Xylanibacillus composti]